MAAHDLTTGRDGAGARAASSRQTDKDEDTRQAASFSDWDGKSFALGLLAAVAVFHTLYFAASFILPLLLAIVLDLLLLPAKRLLTDRLRLPSPAAALFLILALFAGATAVGLAVSLPASAWVAKAPQSVATLEQKLGFLAPAIDFAQRGLEQLERVLASGGTGQGAAAQGAAGQGAAGQGAAGQGAAAPAPSGFGGASLGGIGVSVLEGTQAALGQAFTLLVTLFFILAWGDSLLRRFVEIMPTFGDKRRVIDIANEIERNVSGYLLTITAMNLLVGLGNGLSMWLQGLPDPLLWGTLAFVLNYIPILGPSAGVVIFFLVGLFTTSTLASALLPPAIYLALHIVEGQTVTPMLLARKFTLNPVLVVVSLFFWDWMWGVAGAVLAVPLLAIGKIVCDRIPALVPLGHVLGAPKGGGFEA